MRQVNWRSRVAILPALLALATAAQAQLGSFSAVFWTQDSPGIVTAPEEDAAFGRALAAGDFDCDGLDDLALGIPSRDTLLRADAGFVLVLYGGLGLGPVPAGQELIWQGHTGVDSDGVQANDQFGLVLAAGDFDGNSCADLVVGVPMEDIGDETESGAVHVIYGGPLGLTEHGSDFWHPDVDPLASISLAGDEFGRALAAGDFDDDGVDDLAIGAPGKAVNSEAGAGLVYVLFGSASGLDGDHTTFWDDTPEEDEEFGWALGAADFLPAAGEELAIGIPFFDLPGIDNAGGLVVVSEIGGFPAVRTQWHEDTPGVPGSAEPNDFFGSVLVGGDFDGDGTAELAIGTPNETLGTENTPILGAKGGGGVGLAEGALTVLDFDGGNHQHWIQDDLPPETSDLADAFATSLAAADFDGDGADDLAIGVPGEDHLAGNAGLIHVLYGSPGVGLTTAGRQIWIQGTEIPEVGDEFGVSLAAGQFDGVGAADLAIGAPGETVGVVSDAGAVSVLFSNLHIFSDGFESGNTSAWSSTIP